MLFPPSGYIFPPASKVQKNLCEGVSCFNNNNNNNNNNNGFEVYEGYEGL